MTRRSRARVDAEHPLLQGLNEEDLVIAHGFHDAETVVRQLAAKLLLVHEPNPDNDRVVALVRRLQLLPAVWWQIFDDLIAAAERGEAPGQQPST